MKPSIYRRIRRRTASQEAATAKKDNKQEQSFFGEAAQDTFFQPSPVVQRKCEKCEEDDKKVQRQPEKKEEDKKIMKKEEEKVMKKEEKKEDETIQRKENTSSAPVAQTTGSYISSLNGKGNSLPANDNHFFSVKMGYDFSNVKIHADKDASESAQKINAQAYTYGNHIVFKEGKYQPHTEQGKKLLAHELTHVVQQQQSNHLQMKEDAESSAAGQENTPVQTNEEMEAAKNEEEVLRPVSVPDITTFGQPSMDTVFGKSVRFNGKTDADFDGGVGQTSNLKAMPAKDCKNCSPSDCMTITGKFEITYTVTTNVSLPDVPEGLTPCQHKKVKDAIDKVIAPHEQEHVKAFNTYNGKTTFPINYTGCKDGLQQHLQDINDADGIKRKAAAKAKSDALDPFFVDVDLDCVEPVPPKK